jgi:predicted esterase
VPQLLRLIAIATVVAVSSMRSAAAEPKSIAWCAPELETLHESACYFAPNPDASGARVRTLVIFLHPLVGAGSDWQWEQQRLFARLGSANGFSVLMPRGRLGIGPKRAPDIYAWPTAQKMQAEYEDEIIDEWMRAKRTVEEREGPFTRVLVFGFSNGAYYATSLALRGRLKVDGYGIFAGGSGAKYLRLKAVEPDLRAPIFVGYGTKDPAHKDQQRLIKMLKSLGWKHRSKSAAVGHTVTGDQLIEALRFFAVIDRR